MGDQEISAKVAKERSEAEKARRKEYAEVKKSHREALVQGVYEQQRGFDRAILTITSGAFAVSLIFIEKVAPHPHPTSIALLIGAWAFFAVGMLATLISFLTSLAAHRCAIMDLDVDREHSARREFLGTVTTFLNFAAITLLVLGLLAIIIFAAINMTHRTELISAMTKG